MALAEGVPALTTSAARVDAEGRSAEDAVEVEGEEAAVAHG